MPSDAKATGLMVDYERLARRMNLILCALDWNYVGAVDGRDPINRLISACYKARRSGGWK